MGTKTLGELFERRSPMFLDMGLRHEALPQLLSYAELLWSANEELNLFSRKMTTDEFIDNHLLDCLLPLKYFPLDSQTIADFGSGGGLPAVIYALQFPEKTFHLFEKSPKKQNFLRRCQKGLAPNLVIAGEITPEKLEGVDLITARAFKPIDVLLEISRNYHAKQGRYFLLKGRREKIEAEILLAHKKLKGIKPQIITLHSPALEVERHLVLI